jgi:hypothetical protein
MNSLIGWRLTHGHEKEDQNMPILCKIDRALSCIPVGSVKAQPR